MADRATDFSALPLPPVPIPSTTPPDINGGLSNGVVVGPERDREAMDQEKRLRREIANSNERRRMQSINSGFQSLRNLLPHHEGEKLSKVKIFFSSSKSSFYKNHPIGWVSLLWFHHPQILHHTKSWRTQEHVCPVTSHAIHFDAFSSFPMKWVTSAVKKVPSRKQRGQYVGCIFFRSWRVFHFTSLWAEQ